MFVTLLANVNSFKEGEGLEYGIFSFSLGKFFRKGFLVKTKLKGLIFMEDWTKKEPRFRYMMLDRMRQDCDYYLRIGGSGNCLWAGNEKDQIENMKALWNSFPEKDKPEWLTWEELLEYEKKMCEE